MEIIRTQGYNSNFSKLHILFKMCIFFSFTQGWCGGKEHELGSKALVWGLAQNFAICIFWTNYSGSCFYFILFFNIKTKYIL